MARVQDQHLVRWHAIPPRLSGRLANAGLVWNSPDRPLIDRDQAPCAPRSLPCSPPRHGQQPGSGSPHDGQQDEHCEPDGRNGPQLRLFGPTGFALERSEPPTMRASTSPARTDHSSAGSRAHGPCTRNSTSAATAWIAPRMAAIRCRVRSRATAADARSTGSRRSLQVITLAVELAHTDV